MTKELPEAVCEELRTDLRQFLASRPDIGMLDLTYYTTLSDAAGKNFLNGHLPGGREVIGELRRALTLAKQGEILASAGRNGKVVLTEAGPAELRPAAKTRNFYETDTTRKVAEVLDYCAQNAVIGVCTADFGAGKTEAVRMWRRGRGKNTPSLLMEFDIFSAADTVFFVREFARMLGLETGARWQTCGQVFRAVCEKLCESPRLLIFDQCEPVRPRICQAIRQLHDRTYEAGVGVVLLAAPILLSRLTVSRIADLGALTSRVAVWTALSGVSRAEMAAILKEEGITDVEEDALDMWWKATGGSMRRLMRGIDLLRSKHQGKRVTEKTIATMASFLWGMNLPCVPRHERSGVPLTRGSASLPPLEGQSAVRFERGKAA
jgi:DNA transposition AAA+ family ATPase